MNMRRGYLYLVIAFFFWGSLYVVNKYVMDYVPPLTLHLFRQIIAVGVLYLGTLCTALPSVLWNKSLEVLPATTCSQAFPLQTFFATLLGVVFLHEAITWNFLVGGVLISAGVIVGLSGGKGGGVPKDVS